MSVQVGRDTWSWEEACRLPRWFRQATKRERSGTLRFRALGCRNLEGAILSRVSRCMETLQAMSQLTLGFQQDASGASISLYISSSPHSGPIVSF